MTLRFDAIQLVQSAPPRLKVYQNIKSVLVAMQQIEVGQSAMLDTITSSGSWFRLTVRT